MMYIEHTSLEQNLPDLYKNHNLPTNTVHTTPVHVDQQLTEHFEDNSTTVHQLVSVKCKYNLDIVTNNKSIKSLNEDKDSKKNNKCENLIESKSDESMLTDSEEQYELIDVIDSEENKHGQILDSSESQNEYSLIVVIDTEEDENSQVLNSREEVSDDFLSNIFTEETFLIKYKVVDGDSEQGEENWATTIHIDTISPIFVLQKQYSKPKVKQFPKCYNKETNSSNNIVQKHSVEHLNINKKCVVLDVKSDNNSLQQNNDKDRPQKELIREAFEGLDGLEQKLRKCNKKIQYQMGLNIINKIKKILNFNHSPTKPSSTTDQNRTNNTEEFKDPGNSRKRRLENYNFDDINKYNQIKYRKVQNKFPKFVKSMDNDDFSVDANPRNQLNYSHLNQTPDTIAQKSKPLDAMMDIDYSDDGAGDLPNEHGRRIENSLYMNDEDCFIVNDLENVSSNQPLTLDGKLSQRNSIGRKKTYADILRQHMPQSGGYVLGRQPISSIGSNSGASTSESVRLLGGCTVGTGYSNIRSILTKEKENEDRLKYQQLLEQTAPAVYAATKKITKLQPIHDHQKSDDCSYSFINVRSPRQTLGMGRPTEQPVCTINLLDDEMDIHENSGISLRNKTSILSQRNIEGRASIITSTARSTPMSNGKLSDAKFKNVSNTNTFDILDVDNDDEDITYIGKFPISRRLSRKNLKIVISDSDDDDNDIGGVINLDEKHGSNSIHNSNSTGRTRTMTEVRKSSLPYVDPVNSFQDRLDLNPHMKENWLENLKHRWDQRRQQKKTELEETERLSKKLADERREAELQISERLQNFMIFDSELVVLDDFDPEQETALVELTAEHLKKIESSIYGPANQVLVSKFNLNITRRDIQTLLDRNWLNDEVINFYMNLLTDRSELKHESHALPKVYAMNTFFVPRLLQAGHSGVKRWTRRIDIFSKDIIPIPVHVGGVHWCMAIIHFKDRSIKYYDSMGTPNPSVLRALEQYIKDESLDKRNLPFDTSNFLIESVQDVPRQMNGSDCGVFSCMFAEYISRDRDITFTQENMEYFRKKMILEIVQGELLQ